MTLGALSQQMVMLFILIFSRVSGLFLTAPLLSIQQVPMQIKVGLSMFVSFIFFPQLLATTTPLPMDILTFTIAIVIEVSIGVLMGFVAELVWSILEFAGYEIDSIMGMDMSSTINPISQTNSSITGRLFFIIAAYAFLLMQGHHYYFLGIQQSYHILPIGHLHIQYASLEFIIKMITNIFIIGLELALPIYAVLFIINIIMGVFARLVPQMNVFFLSFPIKITIGLFMLIMFLQSYLMFFPELLSQIPYQFTRFLKLLY